MNIELNPHIIGRLRKNAVKDFCKKNHLEEEESTPYLKKATEFLNKYDRVCELVSGTPSNPFKGRIPIAYRLEPRLSDITAFKDDVLDLPKFGGIPDMSWWFRFVHDQGKMLEEKKTQTLEESIAGYWPRCSCCHRHLMFLGQIDVTEWTRVIHAFTYRKRGEGSNVYDHYDQISGLGSSKVVGLDSLSHRKWWYIFFCNCVDFDNPSSDAVIIQKNKFTRSAIATGKIKDKIKKFKEKAKTPQEIEMVKKIEMIEEFTKPDTCLWSEDEYRKGVEDFMIRNKIHPDHFTAENGTGKIPLRFVKDFDLRFDIDIDYYGAYDDQIYDNFYEFQKSEKDIFGRNSPYSLFGSPRSQQDEPRYMCTFGYEAKRIHRKAPVIAWDDVDRDLTRQMYGCLRCKGQESDTIWAKMDDSCT